MGKYLVLFISMCMVALLCSNCSQKNVERRKVSALTELMAADSLAQHYISMFQLRNEDSSWVDWMIRKKEQFILSALELTFEKYKLPQFCYGCFNTYDILMISDQKGLFHAFPIMDDYQHFTEAANLEDPNLFQIEIGLEKNLNQVLDELDVFASYSMEQEEDVGKLIQFLDFTMDSILGYQKIGKQSAFIFDSLIKANNNRLDTLIKLEKQIIESHDTTIFNSSIQDRSACMACLLEVESNVKSEMLKSQFYLNNSAIYKCHFYTAKDGSLQVSVELLCLECYEYLLM